MRKSYVLISLVVILTTLLGACASAPAAQETQPPMEVTVLVEGTPEVVVITATPEAMPTELPAGSVALNGAGATFPLPVYTEWIYAYQYVDPSVTLNYQGIGSGGGKKAIIDNTVDFAGSDSLLSEEEYTTGGDLQMLPMLAGAVVPIYNIEGLTAEDGKLVLDRATLVGIYDGTINTWNDPAIVALNPDLSSKLPSSAITAVHRSDGSGTTEIFTNALAAFSEDWATNVGAGSSVEWPVDKAGNGVGGKGNQGVAATVQNTPNSIGYVELSYAIANGISFADMVNKAGEKVTANADSLASAMDDFADAFSEQLTTKIVDGDSATSWPIAGYTYMVLHMETMSDCTKAEKLLEYLNWALTDPAAAKRAGDLGYSVLPEAVREKVSAKLAEVTCNGAPVMGK
ncbi:MAG: phosphate ABC transporter substrate-binding protein PstS [Chloroflexi bacterium]|nr:phosphate ABC transporter substrate-binding protein PstS [Chloroflexota bacterium]